MQILTKIHEFLRDHAHDLTSGKWSLPLFLALFCLAGFLTNIPLFHLNRLVPFCVAISFLWLSVQKLQGFFERHWYTVTLGAWAFPFFCFLYGSIGFLFGIPLTKWHGVLAILTSIGIMWQIKKDWKDFWVNTGIVYGFLLCCIFFSSFHESSVDGGAYHQPSAFFLAQGWNPVWDGDLAQFSNQIGCPADDYRTSHSSFFPKGQAVVAGVTSLMTGNVDSGDYFTLEMIFLSFAISLNALKDWLGISAKTALLAGAACGLNSVAIMEVNSGVVDGLLASSMTIFLFSSMAWLKTGKKKWIPFLLMSSIWACSIKFTGPVYIGIMAFLLTLPVLWNSFRKINGFSVPSLRFWVTIAGTAVLGVCLTNVHPYFTSWARYSSPFYPLHSFDPDKFPVEDIEKPFYLSPQFAEANRFQRFVYSFFLGQDIGLYKYTDDYFPVHVNKICRFEIPRTLGFSWLFSVALAISLELLFFVNRWDHWLVLGILIFTVLAQPHSWWSRFVPQLWLFPVLVSLFVSISRENVPGISLQFRLFRNVICFLLLAIGLGIMYQTGRGTLTKAINNAEMYESFLANDGSYMILCAPGVNGFDEETKISYSNTEACAYLNIKVNELTPDHPIFGLNGNGPVHRQDKKDYLYGTAYTSFHLVCHPDQEPKNRSWEELAVEMRSHDAKRKLELIRFLIHLRLHQAHNAWFGTK